TRAGPPASLEAMARRLHVLLDDSELQEIQQIARDRQMTTEQWVREALSEARRREGRVEDKLEAVRKAVRHNFPTADIEQMLSEIEQGYGSEPPAWPESFWRAFGGVTADFARPPQVRMPGEVREAIVFVDEPVPAEARMPDREDMFAEMRPYMVNVEELDDTREAVYTRGEGE
ncbi:MAG: hypothetical protein ACREMY_04560, partial [bacterium]